MHLNLLGIAIFTWNSFLEELELVEVEHNEVSRTEDGHQHTQAAEEQGVEGAAERPPGAQAQESEEVYRGGEGGQHDAWSMTQNKSNN